jgi:hypothetical protein
MARVWFVLPSARPADEANPIFAKWHKQGYNIAVLRKGDAVDADVVVTEQEGQYAGWSSSVNRLAKLVLDADLGCEWIVTAGDDTIPDLNYKADDIARDCMRHFSEAQIAHGTFGVMQPVGDRWWPNHPRGGCSIDHIAGSPWMGREWCERANGGRGPMWPEFFHNYADECLQVVATKLGVFWQRPDIIHYHDHAARRAGPAGWRGIQPEWHAEHGATSYHRDGAIFERLRKNDFKECMPL